MDQRVPRVHTSIEAGPLLLVARERDSVVTIDVAGLLVPKAHASRRDGIATL